MVYGYVYKIENLVNGKTYIGQTIQKPRKREYSHFSMLRRGIHKNPHLQNSFNKYTEANFKFTVLNYATDKKTLDQLESKYINKYNSTDKHCGYNCCDGGANGKLSKETRRKMSESKMGEKNPNHGLFGEKNPFFGRTHSVESRKKISESLKGKMAGKKHPFYGKHLSEETKRKISESRMGAKNCWYGKQLPRKVSENIRKSKMGNGKFGFTGANFRRDCNPERRCWNANIGFNKHMTSLGWYEDPLSCEIIYRVVLDEIIKYGGK